MQMTKLSPSAYILLLQWEREDKKLFRKFRKQQGIMEVINALAEMIVQADAGLKKEPLLTI